MSTWSNTEKGILVVGTAAAAVLVYAIGDVVSALRYDGYNYADQAISELSAFGSPVRALMVTAILVHGGLLIAFGAAVLRVADRRVVRWIGGLLIMLGLVGFPTHTIWAMSSRDLASGFNDTMHITMSGGFSVLVVAVMAVSAAAYRGWVRLYSLVTIALVVGFGVASVGAIRGIEQNDTPWAGAFERINAYAYFAWLVVLAITVVREGPRRAPSESRARMRRQDAGATPIKRSRSGSRPNRSQYDLMTGSRHTPAWS